MKVSTPLPDKPAVRTAPILRQARREFIETLDCQGVPLAGGAGKASVPVLRPIPNR